MPVPRLFCFALFSAVVLWPVGVLHGNVASTISAEAVEILAEKEQTVSPPTGESLVRLPELINSEVALILSNGDELRGTLLQVESGHILLDHPALGEIRIERISLSRVRPRTASPPPAGEAPGIKAEIESGVPPSDAPPTAKPDRLPDPPKANWSGRLQLGLSGSRGSSDSDSARIVASAKRDTPQTILTLRSTYQQTRRDGNRTENRFTGRARNEWLRGDSDWSGFLESELEVAEFLDYDARLRVGAGVVYRFVDTDTTLFSTRLGAGAARKFGGADDDLDPEAIIALALSHRLSPRQRIEFSADWFPDLRDSSDYRAEFRAGWEIGLNEENNLKLRLSLEDRYNSQATRNRNNIDYFAELVYEF